MKQFYSGAIFGAVMTITLGACATNLFPYNYYGLNLVNQKLLGPSSGAYPDLPLSVCSPTPTSESPCVVVLTDTMEKLIEDHENLQNELIACQQGK